MGPYVSAIEHHARDCTYLVKGVDVRKRGEHLNKLLDYDTYIEIDFSRFDMTIHEDIIRIFEQRFLIWPFSRDHPLYYECVGRLNRTTGVSGFGTRYTVRGTRCSGDAHTSISNGILNRFLVWLCLRKLPTTSWTSFHEGDDGVIGVKSRYLNQALYNLQYLGCLGFSAKIKSTRVLEEVIFCGRRLSTDRNGKLTTICDVTRTLRKFNTTVSLGQPDLLLYAKALSYNYTDADTPIVGALSWAVSEVLSYCREKYSDRQLKRAVIKAKSERWLLNDHVSAVHWRRLLNRRLPKVTPASYAAVLEHDGINLDLIQNMEDQFYWWQQLGYIPAEICKLPLDWEPETDRFEYGDLSVHLL